MRFTHSIRVRAPLAEVAHFHSQSAAMAAITPPPITVRVSQAPPELRSGDRMVFTLGLGPLRIPWAARIDDVSINGFTDCQESGPFETWVHRHEFRRVEDGVTDVVDDVRATLRGHPWWGPVGLAMWVGMPLLFAYRGRRTRALLEKPA